MIGAVFPLEFAGLDPTNDQKKQYMYMIESLHENWIYLGYKNEINFSDLEPGEYVFRIKSVNNVNSVKRVKRVKRDGIGNEKEYH